MAERWWRIVAGAADWGRQEGGRGDVDGGMGGGGQKVAVKKVEAVEEVELVMVCGSSWIGVMDRCYGSIQSEMQ